MYLVSRDSEGEGKNMIIESEKYIEQSAFADFISKRLKGLKVKGNVLINNINNSGIVGSILGLEGVGEVKATNVRRGILEEHKIAEVAKEQGMEGPAKYGFVAEGALVDKASKTVETIKEVHTEDGIYFYFFCLFEETSLKKKLITLLINKYSIDVFVHTNPEVQLPVVLLVCQRNQQPSGSKTVTLTSGNVSETIDYLALIIRIKELYMKALPQTAGLNEIVPGRIVVYDANHPEVDPIIPAYTVKLVDSRNPAIIQQRTYACYVVPCGKERGYLYSTEEGNHLLCEQVKVSRLCLVWLNVGHGYKSFEQIRGEIESIVMEKKPKLCIGNVVYLTDSSPTKVDPQRKTIFREEGIIIEDVMDGTGEVTRRLVNIRNYLRAQTQVVLDYEDGDLPAEDESWGLLPPKPGKRPSRNPRMLDYAYNRCLFFGSICLSQKKPKQYTIIGSCSGILGDYIKSYIPDATITEVDIDPTVCAESKRLLLKKNETVCADGLSYIKTISTPQDVIVVDVDMGQEVPVSSFASKDFVEDAFRALGERGVLVFNTVERVGDNGKRLVEELGSVFDAVYSIKALREEFTVVVGCKGVASTKHAEGLVVSGLQVLRDMMGAEDFEENEYAEIRKEVRVQAVKEKEKAN